MRKAKYKKMGYVILPVAIPPGMSTEDALDNNERYRVVWQVLNALRAHDERLDTVINQGGLGQDVSDRIAIVNGNSIDTQELEQVTAVIKELPNRNRRPTLGFDRGGTETDTDHEIQPLPLVVDDFSRAVMAKIVEKCGTRDYWEDWAKDVARIAERHVLRITGLVGQEGSDAQLFFQDFLKELRDDLNKSISEQDAIEMLAQHLITRPVFDALFEGHEFVKHNQVSAAMTEILSVIDETQIERESEELKGFYTSVQKRARGITNSGARQNLITELYEKFFKSAFPRTAKKLGIVYTPVEVVDFTIKSVNDVLMEEFGLTLGSEDVHILDPFTGTGTFITSLLQSGLIPPNDLEHKYSKEIHANEIILLAYYIAAVNIETTFQGITQGSFQPFERICLTDTFALNESDDLEASYMKDNSDRREIQKTKDIKVIIGNPPWEAGKKDHEYKALCKRIEDTYAARSLATLKSSLYDSYKMAIRWASDRIDDRGVIGFVTNGSWIDGNADSGIRACLEEEFTSVFVLNLRGNQRTQGELSRREGGKIFGSGSRAPVAITILVRNPEKKSRGCRILYRDIGDYLTREEKLKIVKNFGSITKIKDCQSIQPNRYHDWINQRNESFYGFIALGSKDHKANKENAENAIFRLYSMGIATSRDSYIYNFNKEVCSENARLMIDSYQSAIKELDNNPNKQDAKNSADKHMKNIHWDRELLNNLQRKKTVEHSRERIWQTQYRPFVSQYCYAEYTLINSKYQQDRIFPTDVTENRAICVSGIGSTKPFSVLMVNKLPDLELISKGQCFPRFRYEEKKNDKQKNLFGDRPQSSTQVDNITKWSLEQFRTYYKDPAITGDMIFDYIYGILHSPIWRERYSSNLARELPRIPFAKDFHIFAVAGSELSRLHLNYETSSEYPLELVFRGEGQLQGEHYRIGTAKMRFTEGGGKSVLKINDYISLADIPKEAHEYVVNGRTPLEWFIDRYRVTTDKKSGIRNDPNDWFDQPSDLVSALRRIVYLSVETVRIVNQLPEPLVDEGVIGS